MAGLYFNSGIDDGFENDLKKMNGDMNKFSHNVQTENQNMDSSFKKLGMAMAGYFSLQAMGQFTKKLIDVRGEFEKLGISFEVMLGNRADADKLMADITATASKTPFSLTEVASGAKQLLAFGESSETVIDTLTRLGDIAAGTGSDIAGLNLAYGQVMAKGKLQTQEMYQFAERGIPIMQGLADVMGVTKAEVSKLVEQGKVGFPIVQQVIKNLTDEGGMFFNLMEKQSASVSGMISNLGDAFDRMLNDIGESNEGIIKDSISGLTSLVENWETVIDTLKTVIVTVGAYKAAVIMTNIMKQAEAVGSLAKALQKTALAQKALNMVQAASPVGLVFAGLSALAGIMLTYSSYVKNAKNEQSNLNDELERTEREINKERITKVLRDLGILKKELIDIGGGLSIERDVVDFSGKGIESMISGVKSFTKSELENLRGVFETELTELQRETADIILPQPGQLVYNLPESVKDLQTVQNVLNVINQELVNISNAGKGVTTIKILSDELAKLEKQRNEATDIEDTAELSRLEKLIEEKEKELELLKVGNKVKEKELEDGFNNEMNLLKQSLLDKQITEEQFQQQSLLKEKTYLEAKLKLVKSVSEKNKIQGQIIDLGFRFAESNISGKSQANELEYAKQLLQLKILYSGQEKLQNEYNVKRLQAERDYLNKKLELADEENEKIGLRSQLIDVEAQLATEQDLLKKSQLSRAEIIRNANDLILQLNAQLQKDITNQEAEAIKQRIETQQKIIKDNSPYSKDDGDTIQNFSELLGQVTGEIDNSFGSLANSILALITTLSLSSFMVTDVVSKIINLVILAGKMIEEKIYENLQSSAEEQDIYNDSLANTISLQARLNQLKKEAYETDLQYSAFLESDYKKQYLSSLQSMMDANSRVIDSLEAMKQGMVFSSEGSTKRFGKTHTKNFNFTIDQLFNETNGGGYKEAIEDYFSMNARMYDDALWKLQQGAKVVLTEMGKTYADVAKFSAEEWEQFFLLMEQGGYVSAEGSKELLEQFKTAQEEYQAALESMKAVIVDIAGSLGDSLTDALVNSVSEGNDAMKEFGKSLNQVLIQMAKAEMNELFFRGLFDQLQSEMEASMAGGDMSWQDDLMRFYNQLPPAIEGAQSFLEQFDQSLQDMGLEGLGNPDNPDNPDQSVSGRIQQAITEETGSELVGRLGAIMLSNERLTNYGEDMLDLATQNLVVLNKIKLNTDYLPAIAENTKKTYEKLSNI